MVGGFNHNFRYKDQVFHVQTEDSGVKKTEITTLLYNGGTILARQTTSYNDILTVDDLPAVVESLMKDQHKAMLKNLKNGNYDEKIATMTSSASSSPAEKPAEKPAGKPAGKPMTLQDVITAYLKAGR